MNEDPHKAGPAEAGDESVLEAFAAGEIEALDGQGHFAASPAPASGKSPLPQDPPPPQPAPAVAPTPPEASSAPPEQPALPMGQYRSDRVRRGADFAWPKDVLDLMQPPHRPHEDLPAGVLVPPDSALPHDDPSLPAADAALTAGVPASPRRWLATRRERLLVLQWLLVAAGAWASVLLAWLLL
ncbi:MAG: hypothetical protein BWX88_02314 [Planctomycetes bacterium ADurb.Bin126]|mgnify:CR=1 FL=1|nr:MAG: hypothetical protein BWX88_02314 [Planctomycetes bacterium ADurb.Bin126]HOD81370.1 hypothetical protein [Phycisphaerae bacterium]HQL73771.1 hypothetical protein [Phycisphaerae bacterium]